MEIASNIIKVMLGNPDYEKLITEIMKEYNNTNLKVSDIEPILSTYFSAILLIGFCKKPVLFNNYTIKLDKHSDIEINTKKFCEKYESYINKIEDIKLGLIKKCS